MDGVGSFGLPAGLSLAEQGHQARESADVTSRRRTKESKSAAAAAAASRGGRSNTGSTSATGASSSSETRNSKGNGYPLQESSSDEDEVSLASLASLAGAGGSRRTSGMSGTHFHESKSSGSTKGRRRGDRSSSKRRKLVESTGSGRSSSLDDSSSAYTNHVANNAGRRRKQHQCRQLQIGAFLSASSSVLERSINSSIGTSASGTSNGTSSSDRTDTVTNDDDGNSTAVAASNTRDKLIGGSDSPPGMTQQPSGGIGRALGENSGTTAREDGDAFDEAHVCLKPKLNTMQFGMQQLCAASALPNGRTSVNVLSELFRRSYPNPNPNSRGGSSLSTLRRFANAPNKWTKCETVRLPGHRHSTVALEFDRQGVLLALGDARGMITVYDFDELCGADMAARRASPWRQMHIRPVLAFGTHSTARISCIKWDPNNDDLLVVSFSTDCRIRIFDLISGSEAGGPNHTVLSDADSLRGRFRTEGNISIHHLPPSSRKVHQLLSGGSYGTVRLWYYPNSRRRKKTQLPTLAWSMSPFLDTHTEGISEICHLENCSFPSSHSNDTSNGSGLILVGGSKGSLAIIDQDRQSKKAFSTKLTPTILWSSNVGRYITRRRLVDGVLPSNSWMGIKKIVLWGESSSHPSPKNSPATVRNAPSEEARMTMVTNCGWTLNASIRGLGRTSRKSSDFSGESTVAFSLQIAHKTAKTMWLNSDLEEIVVGENASTFSLPLSPPPVCTLGQSNLLAIASVKRNVKVMSNKDKRVLSSLPDAEIERLCQDDEDAILLVDASIDRVAVSEHQGKLGSSDSFVVSKIPLGDGTPQALAVHPAGQWMIVGCSDEGREELTLFCQRSKP